MIPLVGPRAIAVSALVVVGSFFLLVGTVGLLRLPNVYNRMHATSKATTLGASSIFLAAAVHFGPGGAGLISLVAIVFLFATAPTGAHVISRAAQKMGVPFEESSWPGTTVDQESSTPSDDGVENGDGESEDDGNGDGESEDDGNGDGERGNGENGDGGSGNGEI